MLDLDSILKFIASFLFHSLLTRHSDRFMVFVCIAIFLVTTLTASQAHRQDLVKLRPLRVLEGTREVLAKRQILGGVHVAYVIFEWSHLAYVLI